MKKLTMFLLGVLLLFGLATNAPAVLFSGIHAGGTGSASMVITIEDSFLTLELDNTSPLTLDDGTGVNTPGITGFGFNLLNGGPSISVQTLTAHNSGGSGITITPDWWVQDTLFAGIRRDFIMHTEGGNIQGALYNPGPAGGFGAAPYYFTTATLIVPLPVDATLDEESLFVRMQNVGEGGQGSLKLFPVPEPATMLLMGCGLLGLGVFGRKKFLKSA